MIKALKENLKIPIILKSKEKTIELAKRLVNLN